MPFKTDKQRKAFFANRGNSKVQRPTIINNCKTDAERRGIKIVSIPPEVLKELNKDKKFVSKQNILKQNIINNRKELKKKVLALADDQFEDSGFTKEEAKDIVFFNKTIPKKLKDHINSFDL